MEATPVDPVVAAVRVAWDALAPTMCAWRAGSANRTSLEEAAQRLTPGTRNALAGAASGELPAKGPLRRAAQRERFFLGAAAALDETCGRFSAARAELPQGRVDAGLAWEEALTDANASRAALLWAAARQALGDIVDDDVPPLCEAARGVVPALDEKASAEKFLGRTRDAWEDVRDHVRRRHGVVEGLPRTLAEAREVHSLPMADVLPVDASRHVARQAVEFWDLPAGTLKRVAVRNRPGVPGFVTTTESGHPRVGWVEAAGTAPFLELVELTVAAAGLIKAGAPAGMEPARLLGRVAALGLLESATLRRALGVAREDADAIQRHGAFVLLREARLCAALCKLDPSTPDEARDVISQAVGGDPDVFEAAFRLCPWPDPSPWPSPLPAEHSRRWLSWRLAGGLSVASREQWDVDFPLRPAFQRHAAETMSRRVVDDDPAPLGAGDAPPEQLAAWFEGLLG